MKLKGLFVLFLALMLSFQIVFPIEKAHAQGITLTANADANQNIINLQWTNPFGGDTVFRLYRMNEQGQWESIPAKATVKVLNIYPDGSGITNTGLSQGQIDLDGKPVPDSGILKTWLLQEGINTVTIDTVSLSSFNANPSRYLKKINGQWNYDAVFYGMWNLDPAVIYPNDQAVEYLRTFIHDGGGFMTSHHTIGYRALDRGVNKLANELGVEIFSNQPYNKCPDYSGRDANGNLYPTVSFELLEDVRCDYSSYWPTGDTVEIVKKGLLTEYPFKVGEIGQVYTIPLQHGLNVFGKGDVWLKTVNPEGFSGIPFKEVTVSPRTGERGTNNFYVHTYNNTAIINSGHSFPKITQAETRIIANTLYYLSQITTDTSWQDRVGMDTAPPNAPDVNISFQSGTFRVTASSEDNGITSQYKVVAERAGTKIESNVATAVLKTGIKGYSYVVDQNPDTIPDAVVESLSSSFNIDQNLDRGFYLHVVAVDNAGNKSEPTHIYFDDKTPPSMQITANTVEPTNQDVVLTVTASDNETTVKRIQLPDGSWLSGDTAVFRVSENGTYVFKAEDLFGNIQTKSFVVNNIDKTPPTAPQIVVNVDTVTVVPGEDDRNGVLDTLIRVNGGEWTSYHAPVKLQDGEYTVEAKSIDGVGNESYTFVHFYVYINTLKKAEQLVRTAEAYPTETKINQAREAVLLLPDVAPEKQELLERLDNLEFQMKANEAIKKVELAEKYKREPYIGNAYEAVNKLPDGDLKQELLDRLQAILDELERLLREQEQQKQQEQLNKLIEEAIKKVELAEKFKREPYLQNAFDAVNALPEGEIKQELLNRLQAILDELERLRQEKERQEQEKQLNKLIEEARKKVELAERNKREPYLQNAYDAVNALPECEEKEALKSRLDAIQKELERMELDKLIAEATKKVELAEKMRKEAYIRQAEEAVNKLPECEEKDALKARLDALKRMLEDEALEKLFQEAEKKVEQAEKYQREPYISNAYEAVYQLPDGERKAALEARLDAIVIGDGKDSLYDEWKKIRDLQAKLLFLDIIKAVERAEKYFSRANIVYAIDKIDRVPDELKEEYKSLFDVLNVRVEKLKATYNAVIADKHLETLIKKAETAVETYERFRTAALKEKAQQAVDALTEPNIKERLQQRIDAVVMDN